MKCALLEMSEGMEDENNQTQHSSSEEQYPIAKTILPFSAKTLKELSLDVEDRVAIFWVNSKLNQTNCDSSE